MKKRPLSKSAARKKLLAAKRVTCLAFTGIILTYPDGTTEHLLSHNVRQDTSMLISLLGEMQCEGHLRTESQSETSIVYLNPTL